MGDADFSDSDMSEGGLPGLPQVQAFVAPTPAKTTSAPKAPVKEPERKKDKDKKKEKDKRAKASPEPQGDPAKNGKAKRDKKAKADKLEKATEKGEKKARAEGPDKAAKKKRRQASGSSSAPAPRKKKRPVASSSDEAAARKRKLLRQSAEDSSDREAVVKTDREAAVKKALEAMNQQDKASDEENPHLSMADDGELRSLLEMLKEREISFGNAQTLREKEELEKELELLRDMVRSRQGSVPPSIAPPTPPRAPEQSLLQAFSAGRKQSLISSFAPADQETSAPARVAPACLEDPEPSTPTPEELRAPASEVQRSSALELPDIAKLRAAVQRHRNSEDAPPEPAKLAAPIDSQEAEEPVQDTAVIIGPTSRAPPVDLPVWCVVPNPDDIEQEVELVRVRAKGPPKRLLPGRRAWMLLGRRVAEPGYEEPDIGLADARTSRKHALVMRNWMGKIFLMDLGSPNGTYINKKKLAAHAPVAWPVGATVYFAGTSTEVFELRVTAPGTVLLAPPDDQEIMSAKRRLERPDWLPPLRPVMPAALSISLPPMPVADPKVASEAPPLYPGDWQVKGAKPDEV